MRDYAAWLLHIAAPTSRESPWTRQIKVRWRWPDRHQAEHAACQRQRPAAFCGTDGFRRTLFDCVVSYWFYVPGQDERRCRRCEPGARTPALWSRAPAASGGGSAGRPAPRAPSGDGAARPPWRGKPCTFCTKARDLRGAHDLRGAPLRFAPLCPWRRLLQPALR